MFITKRKHNKIVKNKDGDIVFYLTQIDDLKKELAEAKNLQSILDKLSSFTLNGIGYPVSGGDWNIKMDLPDTVLQYTDDILGGQVIKQEGTKCLIVDKNGKVKEGLTKQKADKGYSYKLIRE
jgi:hypothetical protein